MQEHHVEIYKLNRPQIQTRQEQMRLQNYQQTKYLRPSRKVPCIPEFTMHSLYYTIIINFSGKKQSEIIKCPRECSHIKFTLFVTQHFTLQRCISWKPEHASETISAKIQANTKTCAKNRMFYLSRKHRGECSLNQRYS